MIYYVRGTLALLGKDYAVIDVSGVGYRVFVTSSCTGKLSTKTGSEVTVYTYYNVREDAAELYGFLETAELGLFGSLITVSGVGPKAAMAVLGTLGADRLVSALSSSDAKLIATSPGVGLKTAQKIILELKDKIGGVPGAADDYSPSGQDTGGTLGTVVDTLTLYGFSRQQILQAIKNVDMNAAIEVIIADTLKILGKM